MSDFEKWFRTRMVHSDYPVYESAKEGYEAATEAMQAKLDAQEKELAALRDRFCIWTAYENNYVPYIQAYQPECESRYFNGQLEGDYCPYCGGKIEVKKLKQHFCNHRFAIQDLKLINADSDGNDRVSWACDKCGKVFNAQCGLDISPRHGKTFRRIVNMKAIK